MSIEKEEVKNKSGAGAGEAYAVEVKNLRVQYKTSGAVVSAVNGIDIRLKKGRTLGIVGETGAGKTTAMLALMKLVPSPPGIVQAEKIAVNGKDILKLGKNELGRVRGREAAMIFQDPMTSLNPVMRVRDQIAESILLHERVSGPEAQRRARAMLETVGIDPERGKEYPHQFSGGMRQRVGIAIALACRPAVLIADEPTSALDVTIQAQVLGLMRKLREEYDSSMILITHDLGVVAEMCDEVAVMYAGRIVEQGSLEQVFNRTRHPYTEGLFGSLPNIRNKVRMLKPIPGLMPDPSKLPAGCAFAPRCLYASERCREAMPERLETETGHFVWCGAYKDSGFQMERKK